MRPEFRKLETVIKESIKNEPVYYLANPGNWGDGLIREGTVKFFRDINLEYRELTVSRADWIKPFFKGGTVIYGGGGGWCDLWNNAPKRIKKLSKRFNVIVLPSTYQHTYSFNNTIFFCRDKFESKNKIPDAYFCHDMAFYLGELNVKKGKGTGYFFRTDKESAGKVDLPVNNYDISLDGNQYSEGVTFLNEISKYEEIHTDRLHVAIAACLTGKKLHLYPGSYFKNYAVYKSSIKGYFADVFFRDEYL